MDYHKTIVTDVETTDLIPEIIVPGKRPGTTKKEKLSYETDYNEYPYIVSIAWKVDDNESKYYILNQEGRKIPEDSIAIHGITDEIASESKTVFAQVLMELIADAKDCEIVVGHNLYFDTSIIKANVLRLIDEGVYLEMLFQDVTQMLHKYKRIDTMRSSAKMMRKWPTLSELYQKIYHKGFDNHHAKNDVEACYKCYQWLKKKGIVPTWEKLQEKAKEKSEIV